MISSWTKHLKTEEEKQTFKNTVLGSKTALNRLSQLLDEELESTKYSQLDPNNYGSTNWPYLQADKIGYARALETVKKIINLDQGTKQL